MNNDPLYFASPLTIFVKANNEFNTYKYKLEKCDAPIRTGEKTTERHTKEGMLIVRMGLTKVQTH